MPSVGYDAKVKLRTLMSYPYLISLNGRVFFPDPVTAKVAKTHSMFSCTPGAAYYNSSSALFSSWHVHVTTEVLEYPEGLPWPMLELGRRQQPGMTTLVDCNGWIDHDSMITLIIIEMIMIIITGVVSRSVT